MGKNYILMTGAPGSKWSFVARSIYNSKDINRSDSSEERSYIRDDMNTAHCGAYWDPGMEFGIGEWDKPFSNNIGRKIIKSHTFSIRLFTLQEKYPIITVQRSDKECFEHWCNVGGWDITYPNYRPYYVNDAVMKAKINQQNTGINFFINNNDVTYVNNNYELGDVLGLNMDNVKFDSYDDMTVNVYIP